MAQKIADILIETLANAGVKRIWGITGDSLNEINDSLRKNGKIQFMHVRHEETAAFAAGAEAAISGELAVCAGSCGPGNLHLINGLYDCHRNHVPVLAIASHIPSSEIGLDYFQETHPQELFKECSDYVELVSNPKQMPEVLARALNVAYSQKGVAVLVIPGDVSLADMPDNTNTNWNKPHIAKARPDTSTIERAAEILNQSKTITILAGSGCANAHDEVIALAQKLKAPVVHALRGKEYIEWDNPNSVGMTGLIGFSSGYHAMLNSDTLLMLGTDFPYRPFYPKDAQVIQIDSNPSAIGKRTTVSLGIVADVKESIQDLLPTLVDDKNSRFLEKALNHYKKARQELDELAVPSKKGIATHPQYLTKCINEIADDNAIFTADVGTPTVWAARYLNMNGKRRLLGSFNHGSMANAMLQAIGAQSIDCDRQVIALAGDGGFSMMMGELLTIKQLNLPVKIIIYNNRSLGFVAMEMKAAGFLNYATDLENPDFSALAKAVGIQGFRIKDSNTLNETLAEAFKIQGPVIIDAVTATQELALPPKIKLEQAKGFSLFMLRAIMNGKGSEIKGLIKENLR